MASGPHAEGRETTLLLGWVSRQGPEQGALCAFIIKDQQFGVKITSRTCGLKLVVEADVARAGGFV